MHDMGNQIEEDRLVAEIDRVLRLVPEHRRRAVAAFLLRAVFGRPYTWIGTKLRISAMQAWAASGAGRTFLDEAIAEGDLTREAVLELIEDLIPGHA